MITTRDLVLLYWIATGVPIFATDNLVVGRAPLTSDTVKKSIAARGKGADASTSSQAPALAQPTPPTPPLPPSAARQSGHPRCLVISLCPRDEVPPILYSVPIRSGPSYGSDGPALVASVLYSFIPS
ncbi:uncharacterized protein A4U43_C05F13970 [Asparagus officinalis]|uniref:Uncharacterized protein n=1 Tax=Asparagus officinalis TaxID=4686 RepID=A0A5P1ESI4_ASPOF|nr:uncharacterized protein A4U43_C05F13970 [Asparagus officinalis]